MDNPNVKACIHRRNKTTTSSSVNIRRHKSLPGPLRSIRTTTGVSSSKTRSSAAPLSTPRLVLLNKKLNPYVGWFRHAPSLAVAKEYHVRLDPSFVLPLKKRRTTYIAKNQHLCSYYHHHDEQRAVVLKLLAEHLHKKDIQLQDLLKKRGYLRGGGRDDELDAFLQEQCAESESVTVKMLSRVACWLLDVPIESTSSTAGGVPQLLPGKSKKLSFDDEEEDDHGASLVSDDEDSEYGNEDDTTTTPRHRSNSLDTRSSSTNDDVPMSLSSLESSNVLSSQAEAYYALTSVHSQILEETVRPRRSNSLGDDASTSSSRLDYDITQMDIVRMNRIASRHLDVESIVRLPVTTYEQDSKDESDQIEETVAAKEAGKDEHEGFSWMLVRQPQDMVETGSTGSRNSKTKNQQAEQDQERDDQETPQRDVCVICLEHFVPGDRLRILPCSHSFHVGCIDRWLSGSHSFDNCFTSGCPTCKKLPCDEQEQVQPSLSSSDGSVPSWAFARVGDVLARESRHF